MNAEGTGSFPAAEPAPVRSQAVAPRAGTKISEVVAALETDAGATIDEIVASTGWLPHTARAALTGLRKRGYAIASDRSDRAGGTVYRIGRTDGDEGVASVTGPTSESEGDSDHVIAANPATPTHRAATRRTGRAA